MMSLAMIGFAHPLMAAPSTSPMSNSVNAAATGAPTAPTTSPISNGMNMAAIGTIIAPTAPNTGTSTATAAYCAALVKYNFQGRIIEVTPDKYSRIQMCEMTYQSAAQMCMVAHNYQGLLGTLVGANLGGTAANNLTYYVNFGFAGSRCVDDAQAAETACISNAIIYSANGPHC